MAKSKKKKSELLWQIDKPGLPGTSYLFGTMHVRDLRAFDYKDLVCEKILCCDAFATEINLNQAELLLGEQSRICQKVKRSKVYLPQKNMRKLLSFFIKQLGCLSSILRALSL